MSFATFCWSKVRSSQAKNDPSFDRNIELNLDIRFSKNPRAVFLLVYKLTEPKIRRANSQPEQKQKERDILSFCEIYKVDFTVVG